VVRRRRKRVTITQVKYDRTLFHTDEHERDRTSHVTLSSELVEEIDRLVQNPHSETRELVDIGLARWTADLPDDEGLVEEQGWVKESV
jgi:hypothetical protein